LNFTVTVASFSPLAYGVIAYIVRDYAMHGVGPLQLLHRGFLAVSFLLIIASRPVENRMLPPGAERGDLPPGRAALAAMVLSGMAEAISIMGVVAVLLGAGFGAYPPFFLLSSLAYLDFRLFRFGRILGLAPEIPPGGGD